MTVTAQEFEQSYYAILDSVLETGIPVIIERNGRKLKIVPEKPGSKLDSLVSRNCVIGDSEDLPDLHWDHLVSKGDDT